MKKTLILIVTCCLFSTAYSQQYIDDVTYDISAIQQIRAFEQSNRVDTIYPVRYYKVAFHIVRKSNGFIEKENIEEDITLSIAYMNSKYAGANVQFYTCGVDYIDDDRYYDFDIGEQSLLMDTYNQSDAINIYLFNTMFQSNGRDMWGYTYIPSLTGSVNIISLRRSTMDELSTIAHEMGHFFGLPHTHNDFGPSNDELVNGSNCRVAGDYFCDTPADPEMDFENDVNENCEYTKDTTDANGERYTPATDLIMSYARHKCRTRFSLEQLATISFWGNQPVRTVFSNMYLLENLSITNNDTIEQDVILLKNCTINSGVTLELTPCAFVEFKEDTEIVLGAEVNVITNE